MNMSTLCTIRVMNRSYFSKARYMIGVGFKILGRTPVPKLLPSYPPPRDFLFCCTYTEKIKIGRAVPLEWAEESRIEKWTESSGPKWFWAKMTWSPVYDLFEMTRIPHTV